MTIKVEDLTKALQPMIQEAVKTQFKENEELKAVVEEKVEEKVEEAVVKEVETKEKKKEVIIAAALKEDKTEEAQKEADKPSWKNGFGEWCESVWMYRMGHRRLPDNRLTFIDKSGNPTAPTPQPELNVEAQDKQVAGQVMKTLTEGTDSAGGFLVPEIFRAEIKSIALENSIVRPNGATVLPMTSDTLLIPRIDDTSHTSTVFGGVLAYWTEEAGTKTATDPTFAQSRLVAKELSGISVISDALLADSAISLAALIKRLFGEAWAYFEDDAFINGNGVGQPLGILASGALIQVTRTDTNNLTYADIPRMWARMFTTSRDRAVWVMNQECERDFLQMGFSGATIAAGDHPAVISAEMGATKNPPKRIFGRPYYVTEKMAALGAANDFGLFDFSYYLIGDRSKLAIDASKHVYFTTNRTAWRFVIRVDGQPWIQAPLTPRNGTDTIGPFVTLTATS